MKMMLTIWQRFWKSGGEELWRNMR